MVQPLLYRVYMIRLSLVPVIFMLVLRLHAQTECSRPPNGLVAWWSAEQTADDAVGANPGVALNGATYEPGKVGDSFRFDGVDDLVSVPASASLELRNFTIEAWINPDTVDLEQPILEYSALAGSAGVHLWISTSPHGGIAAGNLFANIRSVQGGDYPISTEGGLIPERAWSHISFTYDADHGSARLFVNGQVAAAQDGVWITPKTDLPLFLGHRPVGNAEGLALR
jgi:hypothetical protein